MGWGKPGRTQVENIVSTGMTSTRALKVFWPEQCVHKGTYTQIHTHTHLKSPTLSGWTTTHCRDGAVEWQQPGYVSTQKHWEHEWPPERNESWPLSSPPAQEHAVAFSTLLTNGTWAHMANNSPLVATHILGWWMLEEDPTHHQVMMGGCV